MAQAEWLLGITGKRVLKLKQQSVAAALVWVTGASSEGKEYAQNTPSYARLPKVVLGKNTSRLARQGT